MPYVLRRRATGEIAAATQRNRYLLDYYGVRWWESESDAEAERDAFLARESLGPLADWDVVRVDEQNVKIMNVKLKNNPAYRVVMDREGKIAIAPREGGV